MQGLNFYPRSPCGERLDFPRWNNHDGIFLSTLSLRRATGKSNKLAGLKLVFLSTLSLRRATVCAKRKTTRIADFYPRSPCGERLLRPPCFRGRQKISIHALLAESDSWQTCATDQQPNFYPRSPCGERPCGHASHVPFFQISIHALLAESDTYPPQWRTLASDFYPRSPCGERRTPSAARATSTKFLSTLSLRRATHDSGIQPHQGPISIHALLAESDEPTTRRHDKDNIFLSTLSLRRATIVMAVRLMFNLYFYPRSPCGERPKHSKF